MKRLIAVLTVTSCLATSVAALEMASSRGLGQGKTVTFGESTPSELVVIPTGSLTDQQWVIEAGFDRRYELSDFDQFFIAGAYRRGLLSAALGLSQLGGTDFYREQIVKLLAAGHYRAISGGLMVSGRQVAIAGGYDQLRAHAFGLALSYRHRVVRGGVSLDNLNKPTLYAGAVHDNPVYAAYAEVAGHRSFSFMGRVTLEESKDAQLALGQRIALGAYTTFFWGLQTRPVDYGAGIELCLGKHMFTYAASYHPTLGLSFAVTLGTGSKRVQRMPGGDFD